MCEPFAKYALTLIENGFSPLPIKEGTKRPIFDKWDDLRRKPLHPSQIASLVRKHPGLGLGVAGGFNCLVPVDIDTNDKAIQKAILSAIPTPLVAKKAAKGFTSFYWDESGMIEAMKLKNGSDFFAEILVTGQSVLPPTTHPETLLPYKWLTTATLFNTKVDDLPVISEANIANLKQALQPWLPKPEQHMQRLEYRASVTADDKMMVYAKAALNGEARRLAMLSTGRNWGLFSAACKLGRFIYHGALSQAQVEDALIGATRLNGYAAANHGGEKQAWKTLRSGLRKARGDTLPDLTITARRQNAEPYAAIHR